MRRSTRSTAMVGAAAALALISTGWLTAGAAIADDSPTPDPTSSSTDQAPTPPSPETTLPGLHKAGKAGSAHKAPKTPVAAPAATTHGNAFSDAVRPDPTYAYDLYWPSVTFDSTGATVQSGEPRTMEPGRVLDHTMWLRWVAPATGTVSVYANTGTSTDDTGLIVYTGTTFKNLKRIAWNDDQYTPVNGSGLTPGGASPNRNAGILSLQVTKGIVYYIQAGDSVPLGGTTGTGFSNLNVYVDPDRFLPTNDSFSSATALTFAAGSNAIKSFQALLNGATMQYWEPSDNVNTMANYRDQSIWYKYTAPQTGLVAMSSCGFFGGPSIAVFTSAYNSEGGGVGYGDLQSVAFDDASNMSCPGGSVYTGAATSWVALQGNVYYIQIAHMVNTWNASVEDLSISAAFSQPYIDKLNKTAGHVGNTIVISGQTLNPSASMVVKFGSKTATIVGTPTANTIVVKVPSVAKGTYSVTVIDTAANPDDVSNKVSFKVN